MRVLIYEPQFLGHNLAHVALLASELAKLPCEIVIATSRQAIGSTEFAVQLGSLPSHVQLEILDGFQLDRHQRRARTGGVAGSASAYSGLCRAIDRTRPNHVLVPYGNTLSRIACLPLGLSRRLYSEGIEAETLLIGGKYMWSQNSWRSRLRRRVSFEMLARGPWSRVFHLDYRAVVALQAGNDTLRQLVQPMPDPIALPPEQTKSESRQLLQIPTDGRYIVVLGLIEERKGIEPLIGALDALPVDCRLLLAGKCDPPTRELLQRKYGDSLRSGRLIALDRYLEQSEFNAAIFASDVIAAYYPTHLHSSSIVVAAAAARRPVVGATVGWIGRSIETFDLGSTCIPDEAGGVARALREELDRAEQFQLSESGERFVAYNTASNYKATWTVRLRERLGMPPSPGLLKWNWVNAPIAAAA